MADKMVTFIVRVPSRGSARKTKARLQWLLDDWWGPGNAYAIHLPAKLVEQYERAILAAEKKKRKSA